MNEKELLKFCEEYAKSQKLKLNHDKKLVDSIISGLLENEKKYGFRYCPCRVIVNDLEVDRPKICPCSWHRSEIEQTGKCLCGLFVKG